MPALLHINIYYLDVSVPRSNSGIRKRAQRSHGPSDHLSLQHHRLFHCASLAVYLRLKLNTTYQALLIEALCYHITFNSSVLQPKIVFAFDPLYQMFSLSYPQWHLISWVTTNHFQLKLLFPNAYAAFNILLYHCVGWLSLAPLITESHNIFIYLDKMLSASFISDHCYSIFHQLKKKQFSKHRSRQIPVLSDEILLFFNQLQDQAWLSSTCSLRS